MTRLITSLLLVTLVTGCGSVRDSGYNPFNWFGGGSRGAAPQETAQGEVNPLIPKSRASIFRKEVDTTYHGQLVSQLTDLKVDRSPTGAIVRAIGVTAGQNAFDVRLVVDEANTTSTTLAFEMRALQPPYSQANTAEATRRVSAGLALSVQDLRGINTIRVSTAGNSRSARP